MLQGLASGETLISAELDRARAFKITRMTSFSFFLQRDCV